MGGWLEWGGVGGARLWTELLSVANKGKFTGNGKQGTKSFVVAFLPPSPPPSPTSPPSPPSSPPGTFTTKASLQTAVQAYNTNLTAAIATYGPIANWNVSPITDMSSLFHDLRNFNADISSWDTSRVTNMYEMYWVRPARALWPTHPSVEPGPVRCLRHRRPHTPSPASRLSW